MRNIAFLKDKLFPKCSYSEKVDVVQKYLLWKCSSSVDVLILNNSLVKKVTVPKSNCPKNRPILKKWLLGRSLALKKLLFWKVDANKWMFWKRSCSEEIAAQKKYLLCWNSYSEEKWRNSFPQKNCRNICRKGNRHLKKKKMLIWLMTAFNWGCFPREVPSPRLVLMGNLIWIRTRVARIDWVRNH